MDGRCGWSWSTVLSRRPEWLAEGRINILAQLALAKHPDLPDVPLITEFADSEDELMAMELIFARQVMGRPYLAPPEHTRGTPRGAAPRFRCDGPRSGVSRGCRTLQLELNPVSGEEVDALITRIYGASDSAVRLAADAIAKTDGVNANSGR